MNQLPFVQPAEWLRDRRRSVRTASSPSALQGIDREFRRHGLRARVLSSHVPGTPRGTEPPRLKQVHPSVNIRALSFSALRPLAASKWELAGELMEPGWFECSPQCSTNASCLRRVSRTYCESSTMIILRLSGRTMRIIHPENSRGATIRSFQTEGAPAKPVMPVLYSSHG
jgi:hypothetical protein